MPQPLRKDLVKQHLALKAQNIILKREAEFKVTIPEQLFRADHIFWAFYNYAG